MADECSVKVFCRVRPQNAMEEASDGRMSIKFGENTALSHNGKVFQFDRVFDPSSSQEQVYEEAAKPIVEDILSGYNGTIFAFGQTSSGKTHTMEGEIGDPNVQGIIPRIVDGIFQYIYDMDENLEFHIKVALFEIYMEKIRDLLDITKTNLVIHEDKNRVPFVKGVTERFVSSPEEVYATITEGQSNRHIAVTNMNAHSSRSHCVFLIQVKQENLVTQKKLTGKLYLVDLAGSEKVSKTGADGLVLEEAKKINKSLSALGNVIAALADGNKSHVPYRDSKLTRILQESLGGNARTTVIICCSPSSFNDTETRSTLLFGQRAKTIKNTVVINEELTAEEWKRRYECEKERSDHLKAALDLAEAELGRWRGGERVSPSEQISLKEEEEKKAGQEKNLVLVSTLSASERQQFEEERQQLYAQLDEKDDEITSTTQELEQLKADMAQLDLVLQSTRQENVQLSQQLTRSQEDYDKAKEEAQEVLQSLEEVALNYDMKCQEADDQEKEKMALAQQLAGLQDLSEKLRKKLTQTDSMKVLHQRKVAEMVKSLREEMVDFDSLLGTGLEDAHEDTDVSTDEEFTKLRLHLNRVKAEVEDITKLKASLQAAVESSNSKVLSVESELNTCRFTIAQQETKLQALMISLEEVGERKRQLEETADQLSVQFYQLDAQDKFRETSHRDKTKHQEGLLQSANEMKQALEEELESHRDAHRRQISTLRSDIAKLEKSTNELKDELQKKDMSFESMKADCERQKIELRSQSCQLEKLQSKNSIHEKARKELKAVEETVAKELHSLQRVRQDLMEEVQSRAKAGANTELGTLEAQKIAFLENNLDQLTQAHKQLVRNNTDLRCQLPKLERRLTAKRDRVNQLEEAIREFKANAHKEKQRLATELELLKSAYDDRMKRGRSPSARQATIVKAVRPGQHITPSSSGLRPARTSDHSAGPNFVSAGPSPWQPVSSTAQPSNLLSGRAGYVASSRVNPFAASALNFTVSPAPDSALVSAKPFAEVSKRSDVPRCISSEIGVSSKAMTSESQIGIKRSNRTTGDSDKERSKSDRQRPVPVAESHRNRRLPVVPNHVTGGGRQAASVAKRTGVLSATDAVCVVDTASSQQSDLPSQGVVIVHGQEDLV